MLATPAFQESSSRTFFLGGGEGFRMEMIPFHIEKLVYYTESGAVEDTEIVSADGSGTFVQEVDNGYRHDDKDPLYVICNFLWMNDVSTMFFMITDLGRIFFMKYNKIAVLIFLIISLMLTGCSEDDADRLISDIKKVADEAINDQPQHSGKEEDGSVELEPEEVVEYYFDYIKNGKDDKANGLFGAEADENFQTCTVAEYNQVITDLYYGFEKDIPTYPLFEEIRNFNYSISSFDIDQNERYAEVNIEIENCDVALLFGLILEADDGRLESMSDPEIQELYRNAIAQYGDTCMINTEAVFVLEKDLDGHWTIESISPLKDFSTVITGQADELILALNGEDISDDGPNGYDGYDNDVEKDMDLLW